jgi:hypothetical protein
MIQHVWTLPCRVAITDQNTNNVSLVEVLEEIAVAPLEASPDPARPKFPAVFDVVSLWARANPDEPATGQGRVRLVSPRGETLIEQAVEVDLREVRRLRSVGRIMGLPLRGAGTYHFRIDVRPNPDAAWTEVGRVPLEVSVEAPLEGQALQSASSVSGPCK